MKIYAFIIIILFAILIPINVFSDDNTNDNNVSIKIDDNNVLNLKFTDWKIYTTDRENMPTIVLNIIKQIEDSGVSVLLFGMSKNNISGCRITAEETDLPIEDYVEMVQEVNSNDIDEYSDYKIKNINGIDMCLWSYDIKSNKFKYFESIIKVEKYDIRISFWTTKSLYDKKYNEFIKVINTAVLGILQ